MSQTDNRAGELSATLQLPQSGRLPRRDYFLLPLLSLLTIVFIFAATEFTTRLTWTTIEQGYCMMLDPASGPHGVPDCTSIIKLAEGKRAVLHFNNCGYRSEAPCGPKPPGTFRIAVLGSSISEGYGIPYEEMFATRMAQALSQSCHKPVEFQNLGADGCPPAFTYRHVDEALRLRPDAIVMTLNPWDVEQEIDPAVLGLLPRQPPPTNQPPAPAIHLSLLQKLQARVRNSRTMLVAQHFLLQNRDAFLKLYLFAGGDHTAFVRYPFTPAWERRLEMTDVLLGEMARKIHAAGVPFVLVAVPERAQTMMLHVPDLPRGIDPYAFTRRFENICVKYGIVFIDGLKVFKRAGAPDNLFYVVDGHITPEAHNLLAQAISREFTNQGIGVFAQCRRDVARR